MFREKDDLARPHVCALMSLVRAGGNGVRGKIQDSYVGARWRGGGNQKRRFSCYRPGSLLAPLGHFPPPPLFFLFRFSEEAGERPRPANANGTRS